MTVSLLFGSLECHTTILGTGAKSNFLVIYKYIYIHPFLIIGTLSRWLCTHIQRI